MLWLVIITNTVVEPHHINKPRLINYCVDEVASLCGEARVCENI